MEDFLRSGVSCLVTLETFLWAGSSDDSLRSPDDTDVGDLVLSPTGDSLRSAAPVLGEGDFVLSPDPEKIFLTTGVPRLTGEMFRFSTSGPDSFRPTPCLEPAGRLASSSSSSPGSPPTTSSTTALTQARSESNSARSRSRLSWELELSMLNGPEES